MSTDRPGREIPKEYREVITELVSNQGWRYRYRKGGRHPMLYPADRSKSPMTVPTTPSEQRSFANFLAEVRRAGGIWPPQRRK